MLNLGHLGISSSITKPRVNLEHPKNVLFNVRKKFVKIFYKAQQIEA